MPSKKDLEKKKKARRRRPGREDGKVLPQEDSSDVHDDLQVEVGDADEMFDQNAKNAFADREADAQEAFGFAKTSAFEEGADGRAEEPVEESFEESFEEAEKSKKSEKKVHIEFPYSELIRARAPKVFEVAETVATDWVNNGNFENVPVGHPVAQMTVAAGLRKAKEVEKKLEEKGVFMMAKMGMEFAKSKLKR